MRFLHISQRGGEPVSEQDRALLHAAGELIRNSRPDPRQRYAADQGQVDTLLKTLLDQEVSER